MRKMRTIRVLWVSGNIGLVASLLVPPSMETIVMGAADLLCLVAWAATIYRAARAGKLGWACLVAFLPMPAMWVYLFRHQELVPEQPRPARSTGSAVPPLAEAYRASHAVWTSEAFWAPSEPLAMRQAREVVEDAELRFPDW